MRRNVNLKVYLSHTGTRRERIIIILQHISSHAHVLLSRHWSIVSGQLFVRAGRIVFDTRLIHAKNGVRCENNHLFRISYPRTSLSYLALLGAWKITLPSHALFWVNRLLIEIDMRRLARAVFGTSMKTKLVLFIWGSKITLLPI